MSRIFSYLRHWLWLNGLGALLGLGVAFILFANTGAQFQATASGLITVPNGNLAQAAALITQLAHSPTVLATTAQTVTPAVSEEALASHLTVNFDSSGLFTVTITSADPDQAQTLAKTLIEQLVTLNKQLTDNPYATQIQGQIGHLQTEIESGRNAWQTLDDQITKTHDPATLIDLRAQRGDAIDHYLLLQADLAALNNQNSQLINASPVMVAVEPVVAAVEVGRFRVTITLMLGTFLGALGGALLGLWIENADVVLRTPDAAQRALELPTLGTLPLITVQPGEEKLIIRTDTPQAEAYRALAVRLGLSDAPPGWAIGITSPGTNEGKSLTAANLAIVLAQSGRRTVIVDADLRTPTQHRLFKISNRDGLTGLLHEFTLRADLQGDDDILADLLSVSPGLKRTDVPNLSVLTSGPLPAHPEEILVSTYLTRLLRALTAQYDLLVLDLPSAITPGTAERLATGLDLTLLVVDAQRTRRRVARRALAILRQEPGMRLGGVALNRTRTRDLRRAE